MAFRDGQDAEPGETGMAAAAATRSEGAEGSGGEEDRCRPWRSARIALYTGIHTLEDVKAGLAASKEDIAAGRVVPGKVVLHRIQAALDGYEAAKSREAEAQVSARDA